MNFYLFIKYNFVFFFPCFFRIDYVRIFLLPYQEEILKGLPKNDELTRWLRKDLINHVISYSKICHPDNLPAFMKHYVVYRLPPVMPVKCTVATALTSVGNNNNATTSQVIENARMTRYAIGVVVR